ncbi:MAG: DEAD/DEAH box helicase [Bdellovibrionota bacterium]
MAEFLKYLKQLSIKTPTDIQNLCFQPLSEGKSVFALAPTGSGKTLAFVLPLLLQIDCKNRNCELLILAPTRELGSQIARVCNEVSGAISALDDKNILVRTALGGSPIAKQIEELAKKPHVLIATPGRVIDLLGRKALVTKNIKTLILDEADIMVGMGFAEQIELIYSQLPRHLQIGLFSATQNEKVTTLEETLLKNKQHLTLNTKNSSVLGNDNENKLHDAPISHQYISSSTENKFRDLVTFLKQKELKNTDKMLVFCHQRDTVQELAESLKKEGLLADALTGELGQVHRNSIMRNFKSGNLKYLVATNIASRGIDVDKLAAVIHYDVPFTQEDYIHRSGRTGRSGFAKGVSITICDHKTKSIYLKLMEDLKISAEELKIKSVIKPKIKPLNHKLNFIKIHINKGKQDKIRPADILGAFIQDLGFEKEDIGSIFIFNNFTHVEINANKKSTILNKSFKIKNLSVKALSAKQKD